MANYDTTPAQADAPRAQALAFSELADPPSGAQTSLIDPHAAVANPLHNVKAQLSVHVGSVAVTVGELLGAKESQVLRLDRAIGEPVDVMLEGQVVARGELVAVGEHFGVRITELPVPLNV